MELIGILTVFLIPPLLIGVASIFLLRSRLKLINSVFLIVTAIILNDLIWKRIIWSNTSENSPVANIPLMFNLFVAIITVLIELKFAQKQSILKSLLFTLIVPAVISLYFPYFGSYGFTYSVAESNSMKASKENGSFIKELGFSEEAIVIESDTIHILHGWAERDRKVNHKTLFKRDEYSQQVDYIVKVRHNKKGHPYSIKYKVNSRDVNGSAPIDSTMKFSLPAYEPLAYLTFFRISNRSIHNRIAKEVKINFQ